MANERSLIFDLTYDDLPLGKDYSAGLVFTRPFKFPRDVRYKQRFVEPVIFIPPVPKENKTKADREEDIDIYFHELSRDIGRMA